MSPASPRRFGSQRSSGKGSAPPVNQVLDGRARLASAAIDT
jgi:hypothetical protein